jgi:hypothetical protein
VPENEDELNAREKAFSPKNEDEYLSLDLDLMDGVRRLNRK